MRNEVEGAGQGCWVLLPIEGCLNGREECLGRYLPRNSEDRQVSPCEQPSELSKASAERIGACLGARFKRARSACGGEALGLTLNRPLGTQIFQSTCTNQALSR